MDDLYLDTIIDLYKHPHNRGELQKKVDISSNQKLVTIHLKNAGCGDVFTSSIVLEGDQIVDIAWQGEGCAISTASMSAASDWLKGRKFSELSSFDLKVLLSNLGLDTIALAREKCLAMPLQMIKPLLQ